MAPDSDTFEDVEGEFSHTGEKIKIVSVSYYPVVVKLTLISGKERTYRFETKENLVSKPLGDGKYELTFFPGQEKQNQISLQFLGLCKMTWAPVHEKLTKKKKIYKCKDSKKRKRVPPGFDDSVRIAPGFVPVPREVKRRKTNDESPTTQIFSSPVKHSFASPPPKPKRSSFIHPSATRMRQGSSRANKMQQAAKMGKKRVTPKKSRSIMRVDHLPPAAGSQPRLNPFRSTFHRGSALSRYNSNTQWKRTPQTTDFWWKNYQTGEKSGFRNLGNTCYCNAVLRSLLTLRCFTNSLKQKQLVEAILQESSLFRSFVELILEDQQKGHGVLSPAKLKTRFNKLSPLFDNNHQHDAHEFFTEVLNDIHEEMTKQLKGKDIFIKNGKLDEDQLPVPNNFFTEVQHQLTCDKCKYRRLVKEGFFALSLDFPDEIRSRTNPSFKPDREKCKHGHQKSNFICLKKKDSSGYWFKCLQCEKDSKIKGCWAAVAIPAETKKEWTLDELLETFLKPRVLEYTCEICNHNSVTCSSRIKQLPKVLVLHIKRFYPNHQKQTYEKRRDPVKINRKCDLMKFCSGETRLPPEDPDWDVVTSKEELPNPLSACADILNDPIPLQKQAKLSKAEDVMKKDANVDMAIMEIDEGLNLPQEKTSGSKKEEFRDNKENLPPDLDDFSDSFDKMKDLKINGTHSSDLNDQSGVSQPTNTSFDLPDPVWPDLQSSENMDLPPTAPASPIHPNPTEEDLLMAAYLSSETIQKLTSAEKEEVQFEYALFCSLDENSAISKIREHTKELLGKRKSQNHVNNLTYQQKIEMALAESKGEKFQDPFCFEIPSAKEMTYEEQMKRALEESKRDAEKQNPEAKGEKQMTDEEIMEMAANLSIQSYAHEVDELESREKVLVPVDTPEANAPLDIPAWTSCELPKGACTYKLESVVHHKGTKMFAGHYVSDVFSERNILRHDDEYVQKDYSPSQKDDENVYLFFYTRSNFDSSPEQITGSFCEHLVE